MRKILVTLLLLTAACGCAHTNADMTAGREGPRSAEKADPRSPPSPEFVLGPDDAVEVFVWRYPELSRKVQIDPAGRFDYPLIGQVRVAGMTMSKLHDVIQEGMAKYIENPTVSVTLVSYKSQKVYVIGEVVNPGAIDLDQSMGTFEAISRVGGFSKNANMNSVMLIRGAAGKSEITRLDVGSVMKGGDMTQNPIVKGGDIVYVPATYIADVSRFATYLRDILSPILMLEQGIVLAPQVGDAFHGKTGNQTNVFIGTSP